MSHRYALLSIVAALLLGGAVLATTANAQREGRLEGSAETRAALRKALAERRAAEARSTRLEREASARATLPTARRAGCRACARAQQAGPRDRRPGPHRADHARAPALRGIRRRQQRSCAAALCSSSRVVGVLCC